MNEVSSPSPARELVAELTAAITRPETWSDCVHRWSESRPDLLSKRLAVAIIDECRILLDGIHRNGMDPEAVSNGLYAACGKVERSHRAMASAFNPIHAVKRGWIRLGITDDLRTSTTRFTQRLSAWNREAEDAARLAEAAAQVRRLSFVMRSRFETVAEDWKEAEQDFRKPALTLYKHLLTLADEPLPMDIEAMARQLDDRLSQVVIDELTTRRTVFLEQKGLQEWMADVSLQIDPLPDTVRTVDRFRMEGPPSRSDFQMRSELQVLIQNGLFRKVRPVSESMNRQFESLLKRAEELKDMVAVNIDAGNHADEADSETMIRAGLNRAAQRLQELSENYRVRLAAVIDAATADIDAFATMLDEAAENGDYAGIVTYNRELIYRQKAVSLKNKTLAWWSRVVDQALIQYRHGKGVAAGWIHPVRAFLGYPTRSDASTTARTRAADYLRETERRLSELPLIYRTLFRFEPVQDPRYLKGRQALLEAVRESYGRWTAGQYSNVMLVGEQGSGKTSVLDELLRTSFADTARVRIVIPTTIWTEADLLGVLRDGFGLASVDSMEALTGELNRRPPGLIIMEGMQNLYLRHMDGFEAVERFLLLLAETGSRHFWFLTCTRYAWNYLDDVIHVSSTFTHVLSTDHMSAAHIRQAIMSRHRVSGFKAIFTPSERVKRSRAYRKLIDDEEARQAYLETQFFDDLARWARGNITIAMLFWLRSIRDVDTDAFTILPFSEDLIEIGDTFHLDDLFALAAILQHDDIRIDELAMNQNRSVAECRMTLTRLHSRRILHVDNGRYSLNSVLLRPVTLILTTRNILH